MPPIKQLISIFILAILLTACSAEEVNTTSSEPLTISVELADGPMERPRYGVAIKATLTNNTADTLRYGTLSCSWQDTYILDTEELRIQGTSCDKNIPKLAAIPPRGKEKKIMVLVTDRSVEKSPAIRFRVGFHWLNASNYQEAFEKIEQLQNTGIKNTENIVWSNPVEF
ncbi:hypothetical protein [Hymenobacter psychrophilus]|uniref:Uncharacterized protein n=1 Tax=Hymenobacter psychrophilus TaxID=651662 RepID=A0A1H3D7J4_9BACT|nr:hypothetical protein [Hymenobacter psychrophilus]SDX62371.1 hypothetical protein SAMN04488069_102252 [Hymenobacter psychrophilus]